MEIAHSSNDEEQDEPLGIADALMRRGEHLRILMRMAKQDERERTDERNNNENDDTEENAEDEYETLPSGRKVLIYDSYLRHQRYYDDLKHVDYQYIGYGCCGDDKGGRSLVIEQRKSLGKGGICWDAAFILAEHLIANEKEWSTVDDIDDRTTNMPRPRLLELGAGTGLTGLMLAKACRAHVIVTDLPELLPLMRSNLELNFATKECPSASSGDPSICYDTDEDDRNFLRQFGENSVTKSSGTAEARVLRWGVRSDYDGAPYDVVIGADVVASLYDPVALAHTFYELCGPNSKVYLSYKARADEPHRIFEKELKTLFRVVETVCHPNSRNKNPGVSILYARR